jgi:hypothetical protein
MLEALRLTHTESRILTRLVAQGCLSREQAAAITGSVQAHINNLRKKLINCGIAIVGITGFGWELRKADLEKARTLLTAPPTRLIRTGPTEPTKSAWCKIPPAG